MKEEGPRDMFAKELAAVFVRWWDESDLDEIEMASVAYDTIEKFCGSSIEFEMDEELFFEEEDE